MEKVDFLDSTGLGVLVGGLKKVRAHDGSMRLICTQERLLKIFRITGLAKVFASTARRPTRSPTTRATLSAGAARTAPAVTVSIARDPALVRTVRLVAAAVARRAASDEEFVEEVRLAVGEACALMVGQPTRRLRAPRTRSTVRISCSDTLAVRRLRHRPVDVVDAPRQRRRRRRAVGPAARPDRRLRGGTGR